VKRLAVARLWHEGNSFSPVPTTLADFRRREWVSGEAARAFYRGTATELGAAVDFVARRNDWDITFLRCAAAPPGGPITDDAFEAMRDEILEGLRGRPWDAVYLSLHGALVTPTRPAADCDLLTDVRAAVGEIPIAVSLDLHANVGPPLVELANVVTGYKTYPHTDMYETGAVALDLLVRTAEGAIRPTGVLAKVGAILPSFNMRTTDGPMATLRKMAAKMQAVADAAILDVSLFGGFAYGDSPHAGASALVYTDGKKHVAGSVAAGLATALWERRQDFIVDLPGVTEGLARALGSPPGTVAVLDPADNPLSGGIGDTPGLFSGPDRGAAGRAERIRLLLRSAAGRASPRGGGRRQAAVPARRSADRRLRPAAPGRGDRRAADRGPVPQHRADVDEHAGRSRRHGRADGRHHSHHRHGELPVAERPGLFRAARHRPCGDPAALRQGEEPLPRRFRPALPRDRRGRRAGSGSGESARLAVPSRAARAFPAFGRDRSHPGGRAAAGRRLLTRLGRQAPSCRAPRSTKGAALVTRGGRASRGSGR
jgi:hypothetical protein